MIVSTWVHRVDTNKFPAVPEGWRWCVGAGPDPTDPRMWFNAGCAPTESDAAFVGQQCAATAANALHAAGVVFESQYKVLEVDPCLPEHMDAPMPGSVVSDRGVPTPIIQE